MNAIILILKDTGNNIVESYKGENMEEIVRDIITNPYDVREIIPAYYNGNTAYVTEKELIDDIMYDLTHTGFSEISEKISITLA